MFYFQVKIQELNDSKYIGICIYNMMVPMVVGTGIYHLLTKEVNSQYTLTSLCQIVATTLTQCIIFAPKVYAYHFLVLSKLLSINLSTKYYCLKIKFKKLLIMLIHLSLHFGCVTIYCNWIQKLYRRKVSTLLGIKIQPVYDS